ncbi:hypothetical protein LINGRAHAP2_LOCUS31195 [Linum grandiflorum]
MGEYFRSESTRGSLDFLYRLLFLKIRDLSPGNPPPPLQIHLRLWDASKLENPPTPGTSSFGPTSFKPLPDGIANVVLEASETPQPGQIVLAGSNNTYMNALSRHVPNKPWQAQTLTMLLSVFVYDFHH